MARQDARAEARREAFELCLDRPGHVDARTVGDVRVRVAGMTTRGRAARIELTLLHDHHERARRMLAAPDRGLGGGHLLERSPEVDGRCLEAARIAPRDRAVERPVELERARSIAIPA